MTTDENDEPTEEQREREEELGYVRAPFVDADETTRPARPE